jgi:hypothetical protein
MSPKDSAWVDDPTTVVEDPLHPNGFDFTVDLDRQPSNDSGVAAFKAAMDRGEQVSSCRKELGGLE